MKRGKSVVNFIFAFTIFVLFVGSNVPGAVAKKKAKYTLKFATLAPAGIGWAVFVKNRFIPIIDSVTKGEFNIIIYWGGVMGDDEDYIAKMRIGQLDGAGLSAAGAVMACPEMAILELPFLFSGYDEVDYIRNNMREKLGKLVEKNGYVMLMWVDQDFDQIYSTKYEMRRPEDFKNSRILTWYGPLESKVLKALGASPIPVNPPEVITSVRSGVCDAALSPAIWWVGAQLYTVTKYVNPFLIRYSPGMIIITQKAWSILPEKYRKEFFRRVIPIREELNRFVRKSNKECYRAMLKYGVKEVKMTPEELEVFRNRTRPLWYKMADKEYPQEILDEMLAYLKKFRAGKKKTGIEALQ